MFKKNGPSFDEAY